MSSMTPSNIRARRIALWICSSVDLMLLMAFSITSGLIGPAAQGYRWQRFLEVIGRVLFQAGNPIAIILFLMLITGVMHAFKRELRVPAIALAIVSLLTLLLAFHGGIRSDL